MRVAAFIVAVSLVSPAVITAVCELSCLRAAHHAAAAAAPPDCHEHAAGRTDGPVVSGSAALCHDEGAAPAATITSLTLTAFAPAAATPAAILLDSRPRAVVPKYASARPPDRFPISTPLRI